MFPMRQNMSSDLVQKLGITWSLGEVVSIVAATIAKNICSKFQSLEIKHVFKTSSNWTLEVI